MSNFEFPKVNFDSISTKASRQESLRRVYLDAMEKLVADTSGQVTEGGISHSLNASDAKEVSRMSDDELQEWSKFTARDLIQQSEGDGKEKMDFKDLSEQLFESALKLRQACKEVFAKPETEPPVGPIVVQ